MSPDKHFKGTDFRKAQEPQAVRKIKPIVKNDGFEFQICELLSTQKVAGKRGGGAVETRWKIIGVHKTHVGAKNALAKIEEDERLFDTERAAVKFFCGHDGSLDHKAPKTASAVELANLRTAFALRNERAAQMPCLKCFCEMAAAGEATQIKGAAMKWHALLNAPNDWRQVEAPTTPPGPPDPPHRAWDGRHACPTCRARCSVLPEAVLPECSTCKAKLGGYHDAPCAQVGQVLPSECQGYVESVAREVLGRAK